MFSLMPNAKQFSEVIVLIPGIHILANTQHCQFLNFSQFMNIWQQCNVILSFSPLLLINLSMFVFLYCSFGWSLEEYLFKYPAKLSFGSMFYLLICRSSSYILDMSFLLVIYVTNIFSHSVVCLFILLIMSYVEEKYNLMQPNILMFSLW